MPTRCRSIAISPLTAKSLIGLAALLGYRFPANFDQPYRAASLREFWRRWHISLSFWLRDYLYKPLGGYWHGTWRTYLNLAITMLLGGLWHGASWKFVAWGGLHGAGLALERGFGRRRTEPSSRLGRIAATVLVFHFVCLGWILFRADSGETAWLFLKGIATGGPSVQQVTPFTVFFVILGLSLHVAPKDLPWRVGLRLEPWPRWSLGCLRRGRDDHDRRAGSARRGALHLFSVLSGDGDVIGDHGEGRGTNRHVSASRRDGRRRAGGARRVRGRHGAGFATAGQLG